MNKGSLPLAVGGLLALAAGLGIGRFVYTPILPPMVDALSLTKTQAGLIASANFAGYLVGNLLAATRLPGSPRTWLLGALVLNAICLAAMGVSSTMVPFLVVRFIDGICSAFALVFSSALVLDRLTSAGRSGLSAVHFGGVGVGIVVSAAAMAVLVDWRTMWLVSAALALVAAIAVAATIPPDPAGPRTSQRPPPTRLSAAFVIFAAAYFLFGFGYIITATFLVDIVHRSAALRPLEPYVWVLVGLSAAPSILLWGALGRRIGILKAFAVASVVEAVGIAASVLWIQMSGIVVAALFLGGTFMGLTALAVTGAREIGEGDPRRRIALMTASLGVGQIISPTFAGFAYDATGSLALPSLVAAGGLIVAALLALLAETYRKRSPSH
jgi:predicted MFS family arabinose efflux permease